MNNGAMNATPPMGNVPRPDPAGPVPDGGGLGAPARMPPATAAGATAEDDREVRSAQALSPSQGRADFEVLYNRHSREVWALAYARWMNADTAMDITQEAFLR